MLINGREDELVQVTTMLKDKEKHVELNDTKQKFSQAEKIVEQIVELTKKLVDSPGAEYYNGPSSSYEKPNDGFKWQTKRLEAELENTRESLRSKEMEVLAAQRVLTIKDKELEMVLGRLDEKREGTKEGITRDGNDIWKVYDLALEKITGKSIGDLAIEKLQLEVAQLEVEAATRTLEKLSKMSREFLEKVSLSIAVDNDMKIILHDVFETAVSVNNECFGLVET